jgi:hypothetical protein
VVLINVHMKSYSRNSKTNYYTKLYYYSNDLFYFLKCFEGTFYFKLKYK